MSRAAHRINVGPDPEDVAAAALLGENIAVLR